MKPSFTLPSISRRAFLDKAGKGLTASLVASQLAPSVLRGVSPTADPVRVGHIGMGVRGGGAVSYSGNHADCQVVAVCDVYKPHLQKGIEFSRNPNVKAYTDYRDLLNDPKVEAVMIATPDHWHEQMSIDAMEAGKDVYCEKALTMSIPATKRIRAAVRKHDRIFQLGHQGREHAAPYIAGKMIADGDIGAVTLVKTGRYLNGTPEKVPYRWFGAYHNFVRPDPEQVRRDLDWELWLGEAPKVEWDDSRFWHWRCYWDYGTGMAGDLLSHELDFVQTVLGYGIPDTCSASGMIARWDDGRDIPDNFLATYQFERQNCMVQFEGSQNSNRGQTPEFIGTEGRLTFNRIGQSANQFDVFEDKEAYVQPRYPQPKATFSFIPGREHNKPSIFENFLQCVRTREKPWCNEDEAFIESVTTLMSVEADRQKRTVRWDPVREEIV